MLKVVKEDNNHIKSRGNRERGGCGLQRILRFEFGQFRRNIFCLF
jgi:hypothetical protein